MSKMRTPHEPGAKGDTSAGKSTSSSTDAEYYLCKVGCNPAVKGSLSMKALKGALSRQAAVRKKTNLDPLLASCPMMSTIDRALTKVDQIVQRCKWSV